MFSGELWAAVCCAGPCTVGTYSWRAIATSCPGPVTRVASSLRDCFRAYLIPMVDRASATAFDEQTLAGAFLVSWHRLAVR